MAAVSAFVEAACQSIREAQQSDISVEVDVSIESEDLAGQPYLSVAMTPQFLEDMGRNSVTVGFTIANPSVP